MPYFTGHMPGIPQAMQQPHQQSESNGCSSSHSSFSHTHPQRQWSGSSANNSTSILSQYPSAMEEDEQSDTPTTSISPQQSSHEPIPMLSNSSSAPDLRLLLTTGLPDTQHMFPATAGSYAGALVPYKGSQVSAICLAAHMSWNLLLQNQCLTLLAFVHDRLSYVCTTHSSVWNGLAGQCAVLT